MFDMCGQHRKREGSFLGPLFLSLPQPFSVSPILQSFPRGVERATERWGKGAMERAGGQTGAGGRVSRRGGQRPRRRSQLGLPAAAGGRSATMVEERRPPATPASSSPSASRASSNEPASWLAQPHRAARPSIFVRSSAGACVRPSASSAALLTI